MAFDRREFLAASLAAATVACQKTASERQASQPTTSASGKKLGIPGP